MDDPERPQTLPQDFASAQDILGRFFASKLQSWLSDMCPNEKKKRKKTGIMKAIHAHYVSNDWVDVVEDSDGSGLDSSGGDELVEEEPYVIPEKYKGIVEETMVSFPNTPVKPLIFALDLLSSQVVPVVAAVSKHNYTCVDQSEARDLLESITYPKTILSAKQVSFASEFNGCKARLVSLAAMLLTTGATPADIVLSSAVRSIEALLCESPDEETDGYQVIAKYAEKVKDLCGDNKDLLKAVKVQDVGRKEGQLMNWRAKIRTKHKIGYW